MPGRPTSHVVLPLLLGVVAGLVIASIPIAFPRQASASKLSPGAGVASQVAYDQVAPEVHGLGDGPWALISMVGVVATAPLAPFGDGEDRCQTLAGPTLWNLSATGSLDTSLWGGRSLFWQMVFDNETFGMVFASDLNGSVTLDGPYAANNPCVSLLEDDLDGIYPMPYWLPGSQFARNVTDSVNQLGSELWSPTAANHLGNGSLSAWGNIVAYYVTGYTWLNLVQWSNSGWNVWYQTCGSSGKAGLQPFVFTGWAINSSPTTYYGSGSGEISCPVSSDAEYDVTFNQTSLVPVGSGDGLEERLTIGVGSPGSWAYEDTANSLVTWWAGLSLTSSNGTPIASGPELCPSAATQIGDCAAPGHGWYAVLLNPNGWIIDEYPATAENKIWTVPNVFITNNDTLVLVSPQSLIGSGDVLSFTSVQTFPQTTGSVKL